MLEIICSVLLIIGGLFIFLGSYSMVKLPDFYTRLHGPTKASTLGVGSIILAAIIFSAINGGISLKELIITLFLFITAPVAAHMLAKSALHIQVKQRKGSINDELFENAKQQKDSPSD
ncbi:Na+/H+ antiporter subunit G [Alginatibacterium sediminis]|uniref:Na+/H+ antiporter subunit G n=1 Tax=Alginatibacterium sediminis TaxID=2164068 RepID=A0A420EI70_9ALTE|nr:Na+/H+ antiporter subunit G [Alginatibacterium sediminis]RKF20385.1 Na+/H+ antiporter subunit G [Alginatibacterium sediminis]